jgi:hypothetical protein
MGKWIPANTRASADSDAASESGSILRVIVLAGSDGNGGGSGTAPALNVRTKAMSSVPKNRRNTSGARASGRRQRAGIIRIRRGDQARCHRSRPRPATMPRVVRFQLDPPPGQNRAMSLSAESGATPRTSASPSCLTSLSWPRSKASRANQRRSEGHPRRTRPEPLAREGVSGRRNDDAALIEPAGGSAQGRALPSVMSAQSTGRK